VTEAAFNAILIGLLAFFFALLVVVLGWIGARVHTKLDNLYLVLDSKLGEVTNKLGGIERDLRSELTGLDRRISKIEGRVDQ
jgi:hypothetical protein